MSVGKNGNGVYFFTTRYLNSDGKRVQKKVENRKWKTKKEARDAEIAFLDSLKVTPDSITLDSLFDKYINNRADRLKARSLLTVSEIYKKHIQHEFGKISISAISKQQLRTWQRYLLDKNYTNSYLKTIQAVLKRILVWGAMNDLIESNPFTIEFIRRSNEVRVEIHYYTLEEYLRFTSVIDNAVEKLIFDILYWCGVRRGELQALQFKDIDLIERTITINKSYDPRNRLVTTPKTANSYRKILLTEKLFIALKEYINQSKLLAGYDDTLFLFGIDKPIAASTLERHKNEYCMRAGLHQIRIHDFRHSHVSLLVNNNVSDFDIAKRLGHTRDMVNNIYGHWFRKSQERLVDLLNTLSSETDQKTSDRAKH